MTHSKGAILKVDNNYLAVVVDKLDNYYVAVNLESANIEKIPFLGNIKYCGSYGHYSKLYNTAKDFNKATDKILGIVWKNNY